MNYGNGNPLIEAETTLVGWTNRSAIRSSERTYLSGEEVLLNTKLDAASRFSLVVSHPGAPSPVEVQLYFAPVLRDGTIGTWVVATTVALPAEGGRVEAFLSGRDIQLNSADLVDVDLPAVCFAKAEVNPATPDGMHVGLTATIPA